MKQTRIKSLALEALRTTPFKRKAFFLSTDALLIALSMYVSFWLRFDGAILPVYLKNLWIYILFVAAIKMSVIAVHGLYNISWRFFSLKDLLKLARAVVIATLIMAMGFYFLRAIPAFNVMPRSVLLLDFNFTLGLLGLMRISKRALQEYRLRRAGLMRGRSKVLIIGAGSAGEQIVREFFSSRKSIHFPVGFVDDDEAKQGVEIHGVKVLGKREDIPKILAGNSIDEVLIAIPSASSQEIRRIVDLVRSTGLVQKLKVLPGIHDIIEGKVNLTDFKDIQVEDLLGRDPVRIDFERIRNFAKGKRVLVSGAGGSIGGELARMIAQFGPSKLILLDNDETELFYIMNRLKASLSVLFPVVGTIRDRDKMNAVFERFRPEIVLHAAALKHVPILEHYPEEAVKTNVLGTRILGEAAVRHGAERFVNISTDKAINPTSVMGATKRIAEEVLRALNERNGTRFISVRFGNVLGSRGSVIPLFKEQIKRGGPVTVTHIEMKRYFMAISEAVLLVLEAAVTGKGGETFLLDMGNPVKIDDLARDMIRLSGYEPDVDISIVYTGLRAGEKLYEELLGAEEGSVPTEHEKIYLARNSRAVNIRALEEGVEALSRACDGGEYRKDRLITLIKALVPTYTPRGDEVSIYQW